MQELLTKADLLKGVLVDFTAEHKTIATNTLKIAQALDVKHGNVTRVVRRLIKNGKFSSCFKGIDNPTSERIYSDNLNRKQPFFELGEVAALQVIMNMKGDKADNLHREVAQDFVLMKGELLNWRTGRLQASESTKSANDSIYWLKTELEKSIPTSKRCTMLFIHVQQAINKAITDKSTIERSSLPISQLEGLNDLENSVKESIDRLKGDGLPAQEIRGEILRLIKSGALQ